MIFYSLAFLLFFLGMSVLFHASRTVKWQHRVVLLANMLFYAYWDIRFLLLLLSLVLVCYLAALGYERNKKQSYITIAVALCLLVLGIFKYLNFFLSSFCSAFGISNVHTLKIILPLGISFYIFQTLSYVLDVKKGSISAERDFVKLAAYISFFPQVTSGPIVKAHDFLPQMESLHKINKANLVSGLQLFLLGLTKKVVIADRIGMAVNAVYQTPEIYNGVSILFAIIGYSIQIYCDFSGYSDMAVGIARIWGFDLGKNFNMPYLASNPSDFWRRWHISLSSWFRDYVYIPLGGGRCSKWKTYRNLLITMLLSGVWHGANWTFVLWGGVHALGSMIYKGYRDVLGKEKSKIGNGISILLNTVFISLLWVIFRADSLSHALEIFVGLFRWDGICFISIFTVVYTLLIFLGHLLAYWKQNGNTVEPALDLNLFRNKVLLCIWIFLIVMFAYAGESAFIYAQF